MSISLGLGLSACQLWGQGHRKQLQNSALALVLPNKDQVLLLDGRPISLSLFMGLRESMKSSPLEVVVWTAKAVLILQNEARARGNEVSTQTALGVARYASEELPLQVVDSEIQVYLGSGEKVPPPYIFKNQIDLLLLRSVIQENEALLRQFH